MASDPLYDLHPISPRGLEAPNVARIVVDGQNQADDYLKLRIDPADPDLFSWTRCFYAALPAPCPVPSGG